MPSTPLTRTSSPDSNSRAVIERHPAPEAPQTGPKAEFIIAEALYKCRRGPELCGRPHARQPQIGCPVGCIKLLVKSTRSKLLSLIRTPGLEAKRLGNALKPLKGTSSPNHCNRHRADACFLLPHSFPHQRSILASAACAPASATES